MIIVRLQGGMGNQMFQYAFGRALSLKHGVPLGLDLKPLLDRTPRKNFTFRNFDLDVFNIQAEVVPQSKVPTLYRSHFSGKLTIYIDKLRQKLFKIKGQEKHFHFDSEALSWGQNVYLEGYWQSPKYFEGFEDIIRKDFTLKGPLSGKSQLLMNEIKNCSAVCLHVRRTDFVNNKLHDIFDREYYDKAFEYINQKSAIEKVFVFSDDIEWCEQNLKFPYPAVYVGKEYAGRKAEGHLILMSACKHFVIANSSFSWWGAWLGDSPSKIVIAPKQWFGKTTIDSTDLIPKAWIRL